MEAPIVLGLFGGHAHDAPDVRLAGVVSREVLQEMTSIDAVGLDSTSASIDPKAGRVDDDVLDAQVLEESVNPERIATSLVAAADARLRRETQLVLGTREPLDERRGVAGGQLPAQDARLSRARGGLPLRHAEVEPDVEAGWGGVGGRIVSGHRESLRRETRPAPRAGQPA